jgi:hypothetical protein
MDNPTSASPKSPKSSSFKHVPEDSSGAPKSSKSSKVVSLKLGAGGLIPEFVFNGSLAAQTEAPNVRSSSIMLEAEFQEAKGTDVTCDM